MVSKPVLIGGAVALGAVALLAMGGTSHAAPALPPEPTPPPLPPDGSGTVTIPEVTVYGDPAAIAWAASTQAAASALGQAQGEGAGCAYGATIHAFQLAYNADPTSQHPENVLGTAAAPVHSLQVDGKFGAQTATALMYVNGDMRASLCG